MFSLNYSTRCEVAGTIRFRKQPWRLGHVRDVDGVVWDINGYFGNGGKPWVQAVRVGEMHPYYTDTSNTRWGGMISQEWLPYWVEIVPAPEAAAT